jgi:hypothetical protein
MRPRNRSISLRGGSCSLQRSKNAYTDVRAGINRQCPPLDPIAGQVANRDQYRPRSWLIGVQPRPLRNAAITARASGSSSSHCSSVMSEGYRGAR